MPPPKLLRRIPTMKNRESLAWALEKYLKRQLQDTDWQLKHTRRADMYLMGYYDALADTQDQLDALVKKGKK